ncbi:MAG: CBS domain-containing protein [Thermoleophilia bacterium]|nr:CBS domain-containing protein [Thermoleophilia bacterium]
MRVKDIMQADVVTTGPDTTVEELADLLAERKISGVPVVDDQSRVVGMVSEADVIMQDADLHFPHYVQLLESIIYLESIKKFEERYRKAFGTRVADIMSKEVVAISPEASVREAATLMADRKVNRLPVTEQRRLVGIVTRGDIVRAIAESKV